MAMIYALYIHGHSGLYIGCTRGKIAKRVREHRCLLKAGKHTCAPLQKVWNDMPHPEVFALEWAECEDDLVSRRAAELAAMDQVGDRLLNDRNSFQPTPEAIRKGIEASRHVTGRRWTPEANEKRRLAQLGKPKGHGAKISATKQARKAQQVMR